MKYKVFPKMGSSLVLTNLQLLPCCKVLIWNSLFQDCDHAVIFVFEQWKHLTPSLTRNKLSWRSSPAQTSWSLEAGFLSCLIQIYVKRLLSYVKYFIFNSVLSLGQNVPCRQHSIFTKSQTVFTEPLVLGLAAKWWN